MRYLLLYGDSLCASANYKTSGNEKDLCEFNTETLETKFGEETSNPEFTHFHIVKG